MMNFLLPPTFIWSNMRHESGQMLTLTNRYNGRRIFWVVTCFLFLVITVEMTALCAESELAIEHDRYFTALLNNLSHPSLRVRQNAIKELDLLRDVRAVPPLIDLMALESGQASEISKVLARISAHDFGELWSSWAAWSHRSGMAVHPEYPHFKRELLAQRDPAFESFSLDDETLAASLKDIFWSGESKDAIPALLNPKFLNRREAAFLTDDDIVYGIKIGEEARAYPARILDWHLIVNDSIANRPLCLVLCPYSGAAMAYASTVDAHVLTFGYSGLTYLNSLVLYDHQRSSLWSAFNGKALSGALARDTVSLAVIPVTQTAWQDWQKRFPDTTVMGESTGYRRPYSEPSPYMATFSDESESISEGGNTDSGEEDLYGRNVIYGVTLGLGQKAYLPSFLGEKGVVNDAVDGVNFVVVADNLSSAVRVYDRGAHQFKLHRRFELTDERDRVWRVEEDRLLLPETKEALKRLPGRHATAAAWFSWYPESEYVYGRGKTV